ncbi:MAG: biotin/lipoyl-binding protein, partial [Kangiellaceae bacterium]
MKKPVILTLLILAVIAIPVAKHYFSADSQKEVTIQSISKHKIKASILASGQLKHEQEVKLSAEVIGKVTGLFVEEGNYVTKGQMVLQIDDESYLAAVEQQQAVVNQQTVAIERQKLVVINLEKQLQRSRELFNKGLLDHDAYEAAVHRHRLAQVDKDSSYEQLKQVKA